MLLPPNAFYLNIILCPILSLVKVKYNFNNVFFVFFFFYETTRPVCKEYSGINAPNRPPSSKCKGKTRGLMTLMIIFGAVHRAPPLGAKAKYVGVSAWRWRKMASHLKQVATVLFWKSLKAYGHTCGALGNQWEGVFCVTLDRKSLR